MLIQPATPPAQAFWQRNGARIAIGAVLLLGLVLLFYRASPPDSGSLARLALLHGVQRIRGESEESLRHRTTAASRWPYSHPDAKFVWWARAWRRMTAGIRPK